MALGCAASTNGFGTNSASGFCVYTEGLWDSSVKSFGGLTDSKAVTSAVLGRDKDPDDESAEAADATFIGVNVLTFSSFLPTVPDMLPGFLADTADAATGEGVCRFDISGGDPLVTATVTCGVCAWIGGFGFLLFSWILELPAEIVKNPLIANRKYDFILDKRRFV
jgi:hypothetical protein